MNSRYVTPAADHRLNLVKMFTLAKPLGKDDTEVYVEQNPEGSVMADGCRVLKIGTELVTVYQIHDRSALPVHRVFQGSLPHYDMFPAGRTYFRDTGCERVRGHQCVY
ncbi:MAG: hypothetical protein AB2L24_12585 [Mangrovibacterium sp.]